MLDLEDSLIKDVARYQIALLNLCSADVTYALLANFPFLVEQVGKYGRNHLRDGDEDGTGSSVAKNKSAALGVAQGRTYPEGLSPPTFINPSSEPLQVSLALQDRLEANIRKLVNLAVMSMASRASAESKQMDNQGLEAGLSFIGLQLEAGERRLADFWAAYEQLDPTKRQIATVKYPDRYALKSDNERIDEAGKLRELMFSIPSLTAKKEIGKLLSSTLLAGKVKLDILETIDKEIEAAKYATSDPGIIKTAVENGLCGPETASDALGFDGKVEAKAAQDAHVERATEIAQAQAKAQAASNPAASNPAASNPAARGVPDLSPNVNGGKDEKAASRNTDLNSSTKPLVRGEGK